MDAIHEKEHTFEFKCRSFSLNFEESSFVSSPAKLPPAELASSQSGDSGIISTSGTHEKYAAPTQRWRYLKPRKLSQAKVSWKYYYTQKMWHTVPQLGTYCHAPCKVVNSTYNEVGVRHPLERTLCSTASIMSMWQTGYYFLASTRPTSGMLDSCVPCASIHLLYLAVLGPLCVLTTRRDPPAAWVRVSDSAGNGQQICLSDDIRRLRFADWTKTVVALVSC